MSEETHEPTLPPLPARLGAVFRSLRKGRHISRFDDKDFIDLKRHVQEYAHIFKGLGFTLRHHPQDFFYLEGNEALRSDQIRRVLIFLLILFQDLEEHKFQDQHRAWERNLLIKSFHMDELPHFHTAQRRSLMTAIGTDEAMLPKLVQFMERLGIVRLLPGNQFAFLPPVYRFVDLCIHVAETDPSSNGNDLAEAFTDSAEERTA